MTTSLPNGLGAPADRALAGAGIASLDDVAEWREADLAALHGVGPRALAGLRSALARAGAGFRAQTSQDEGPARIGDWLEEQEPATSASLRHLRSTLRRILPHADEGWSYGMPALLLQGTAVAGYGAGADHCQYAPMSGAVLDTVADDLDGYETSKGVLRFPPGHRLPVALVRRLVAARLVEVSDVASGMRRDYHADGRVKAEGPMRDGELHGPWWWYRADGSLLRSGTFRAGESVGDWTTWTRRGDPV